MTAAAVPDPRFRDQLARAYAEWVCSPFDPTHWQTENGYDLADRIEKFVAAEVEACVQAAANQRAAEALRAMADWTVYTGYADAAVLREFRDRAAALAQPAPEEKP